MIDKGLPLFLCIYLTTDNFCYLWGIFSSLASINPIQSIEEIYCLKYFQLIYNFPKKKNRANNITCRKLIFNVSVKINLCLSLIYANKLIDTARINE